MRADIGPARMLHRGSHRHAGLGFAMHNFAQMHKKITEFLLRIADFNAAGIARDNHPGIAHLATAFGIEWRLVQQHRHFSADRGVIYHLAIHHQRGDLALGNFGGIAKEFAGADLLLHIEPEAFGRRFPAAGPGRTGAALLLGHGGVEAFHIHRAAFTAQRILRQVQGEAEGII